MTTPAAPATPCTNWNTDGATCPDFGKFTCSNRYLVAYCGPECQKCHWPIHKSKCKSALSKASWTPDWFLQGRQPAFVGANDQEKFGGSNYLWGNVPALDILRLEANEGKDYNKKLNLLFTASGDFRNVIKTIAQLPEDYDKPVSITINDRDFDIVARNVIMLLIAPSVEDQDEAIDCIIHIWYSAFIRKSDLDIIQQRVRRLIANICKEQKEKPADHRIVTTWEFGRWSLKLDLQKSVWDNLLLFTEIPKGLTTEKANEIRTATALAESRKDYRDRYFLFLSPFRRVAAQHFREDGILQPFGSQRAEFSEPNPTIFQEDTSVWPMRDNADPLDGWSAKDVESTPNGPAKADIYGKLFHYLRSVLRAFLGRIASLRVSFRLLQVDARLLPGHLTNGTFDRIEARASNITDSYYLGIDNTIITLAPLLREIQANPHATLITLFMNAVHELMARGIHLPNPALDNGVTQRLHNFFLSGRPSGGRMILKSSSFHRLVIPCDTLMITSTSFKFHQVAKNVGAIIKEEYTIVEKWPFRLKLQPGQPGAQEEFDHLMSAGVSGTERYVEWTTGPVTLDAPDLSWQRSSLAKLAKFQQTGQFQLF
ncbi:uncharacterized protein FTOL_07248 [Fusarium torulosum]|uniref:MYND-type domain-containing protein n=1 Tax=Fusarium torulosum TaxID=33205 RepID=A0AAE8MAY8_9HYPO|nr:uncharacterized protein FTOL_07248 [Fusarium torulosum]